MVRFHPPGAKVISIKRYTSSRSLGMGNVLYLLSALCEELTTTIEAGGGLCRVGWLLPWGRLRNSMTISKLAQSNLFGMETIASYIRGMWWIPVRSLIA